MDEKLFSELLKEMTEKYVPVAVRQTRFAKGEVTAEAKDGSTRTYLYDFGACSVRQDALPLFYWRNKRRYREMKSILETGMVGEPLAMRIHHIVPHSFFEQTLTDLIVYEADLAEFITGRRIERIFADFSGDAYTNCIVSAQGNFKISMELGFLPDNSEPVLLHEVIARDGIASDIAVDTQMRQYPVYVVKQNETKRYTDIDAELYGLAPEEADCVRFILDTFLYPDEHDKLKAQSAHLLQIADAAKRAGEALRYMEVEA